MTRRNAHIEIRIALAYLIFGILWIVVTDTLVHFLVHDSDLETTLQTYKGWLFVLASSVLLYVLSRYYLRKQREYEAMLAVSEERNRLVLECSLDAILLTQPDGQVTYANPAASLIFNRSHEEICRIGRAGLVDMADPRLAAALMQRDQTGRFSGELTFLRKDGSKFPGEITTALFTDSDGQIHSSMIIRDISQRKQLEEAVRASRERLYRTIDEISDAFIILDREFRISYINPEAARINKKPPEAFLGKTHWEEWPASVGTVVEENYRKAMDFGIPVHFEHRYIEPGNHDLWLDIHAYPTDEGLAIFYRDVTEKKRSEESLRESQSRLLQLNAELLRVYDATIEGWSKAMDLRDKETEGHTLRVTEMTMELARMMGVTEDELVHIRRGALLHDIGKMGIPDSILLKPGRLTPEERKIIEQHPVFAYEMLHTIEYLRPALDIPYLHHEKWDGSGYPHGLKKEEIPLPARLFAIVDVFDAVTSDRPYRASWTPEVALQYIQSESGKHFDPLVVAMFLKYIEIRGFNPT